MEINEEKLKKILDQQEQNIQKNIDKSLEEQRKEYQVYLGVLKEDFDDKVQLIAEQYGSIIERLDSHAEMIGKLAVDMEIVKTDISFIKGSLQKKVDYEEFEALVRRVAILEAKR